MLPDILLGFPLNSTALQLQRKWYRRIVHAYSQPGRYFHNIQHLDETHMAFNTIVDGSCPYTGEEKSLVRMIGLYAITFHDYVWDPSVIIRYPGDCEARSAQVARMAVSELSPEIEGLPDLVSACIEATATHKVDPAVTKGKGVLGYAMRAVCDADMSILSTFEWRYDEYVEDVAHEFCSVIPQGDYVNGRLLWIAKMLGSDRMFLSHGLNKGYEEVARENLQRELDWYNEYS